MTNKELNKYLAEKIMGWKIKPCVCGCRAEYWVNDAGYQEYMINGKAWNPAEDRNQMARCEERIPEVNKSLMEIF